jgi:hypothetical protein
LVGGADPAARTSLGSNPAVSGKAVGGSSISIYSERYIGSESRHDSLGSTSGSSASNYSSSAGSPRNRPPSISGSHFSGAGHSSRSHLPHPPAHFSQQQHLPHTAEAAGNMVSGSWGAPSFSLSLEFKCTATAAHGPVAGVDSSSAIGARTTAWGDSSMERSQQSGSEYDASGDQQASEGPQPGVFQVILGWQGGWQPRYTALQVSLSCYRVTQTVAGVRGRVK